MLIFAVALQAASSMTMVNEQEMAWADCLGQRAVALSVSPDPAGTVVDAAFAICHEIETRAKLEKRDYVTSHLLQRGVVASPAEAERLADGAEAEGWANVTAEMRGMIIAAVVQARANAARLRR
jgi:hypothetical protein